MIDNNRIVSSKSKVVLKIKIVKMNNPDCHIKSISCLFNNIKEYDSGLAMNFRQKNGLKIKTKFPVALHSGPKSKP